MHHMKTEVYFIRHAESDISIKNDMERPLTNDGKNNSIKIVEKFNKIIFENIYSSPYKRTIQTIEPLAKRQNKEIIIIDDFRERKIGNVWIDNFEEFSKRQWENFNYKLDNGESLFEVQKRNIKNLEKILLKNKGEIIAIGTHGTALSTIINYYNRNFGYEDFKQLVPIMPYIVRFAFEEDKNIEICEI
ncbi:phosphoglycerate mutase [Spirochaetia bacterium]|nr:phosphoglycerate mutase [Spirochaetia bacterium]